MPSSNTASMIRAFCHTLGEGLTEASNNSNHRAARHQVTVISELTLEISRIAKHRSLENDDTQPIRAVIAQGREVSDALPRICQECEELYMHHPPRTTMTNCQYCTEEITHGALPNDAGP